MCDHDWLHFAELVQGARFKHISQEGTLVYYDDENLIRVLRHLIKISVEAYFQSPRE